MGQARGGPDGDRGAARACGLRLWLLAGVFYVFTAGGSLTTTDAVVTFELTRQMTEHGTVALPRNMLGLEAHRGHDGRYYSPFGIAQSIVNVPFFLAARAVESAGLRVGPGDALPKAAVAMGNTVVMASVIWLVYLFAFELGGSVRAAAAVAAGAAVATPLWPYSKFGFNAPLSALCLTAAALAARRAAARPPRHAAWTGLWVGLSMLTRHELAVVLAPIAVYWLMAAPVRRDAVGRIGWCAAGLAPGAAAWLFYNWWRFGNPLDAGYLRDSTPAFGSSLAGGLAGLLVSPQSSLLVYCPLAVAGVAGIVALLGRERATGVLLGGIVLTLVVFYAQLGNWMGGRSYGPRYLVAVLPLLCVAMTPLLLAPRLRPALLALAMVSAAVQVPGVLVDYAKVSVAAAHASGTSGDRLRAEWATSALALNARAAGRAAVDNARWLLGAAPRPPLSGGQRLERGQFSQQFAYSLDFWWLYLFHMRVIGAAGVALAVTAFLALLAGLGLSLWRHLPARWDTPAIAATMND